MKKLEQCKYLREKLKGKWDGQSQTNSPSSSVLFTQPGSGSLGFQAVRLSQLYLVTPGTEPGTFWVQGRCSPTVLEPALECTGYRIRFGWTPFWQIEGNSGKIHLRCITLEDSGTTWRRMPVWQPNIMPPHLGPLAAYIIDLLLHCWAPAIFSPGWNPSRIQMSLLPSPSALGAFHIEQPLQPYSLA